MLIRQLATGHYQLVSASGARQGTLAELAPAVAQAPLTLVLPASACALRQVTFASHERRLLEKVIPYTLEDDLVDRVDDLHFVICTLPGQDKRQDNAAAVCYLDKQVLQQALQPLQELALNVRAALPEQLLLPYGPGQWTLVFPGNGECLVRTGAAEGMAAAMANLPLLLGALAREQQPPARLAIVHAPGAESPDAGMLAAMVPGFAGEVTSSVAEYWEVLHRGMAGDGVLMRDLNLLSGEFTPQFPWGGWWRQWRVAAALLLAIGCADLAARVIEINRLEGQVRELTRETESVFRQVMPEGAVVDPRLQLQRRLAVLEGNSAEGFVALLNRAAPVIMDNPRLDVQTLNYSGRDAEIQLTLVTPDFNTAEAARAGLQTLGLAAELTGSTSAPEGNRSSLSIGEGG